MKLMVCQGCGAVETLEEFQQRMFEDCVSKDHYIGLLEDAMCGECCVDQMEEVEGEICEECEGTGECCGTYEWRGVRGDAEWECEACGGKGYIAAEVKV